MNTIFRERPDMNRLLFVFLLICSITVNGYAQMQTDICENILPKNWQVVNGKLSLSDQHFKLGKQAVKWSWTAGQKSRLHISDKAFEAVAGNPRSTFVVWIYNETPINDKLLFQFGSGVKTASGFEFKLNFKGWRTAWVMYHRDMQGKPVEGMNAMQVIAPASVKNGTVFLDQLMYDVTINPRSPMRDEQLPFINPDADKAANAHWNALYNFSHSPHYLTLAEGVSRQELLDLELISSRYIDMIMPVKGTLVKNMLEEIEKGFAYWNIRREGSRISGRPVYSMNDTELVSLSPAENVKEANRLSGIKRYTQLMLQVAQAFHAGTDAKEKLRLENIFMDMLDHLEDQGWAYGSGMGALHHHGYNLEGYYPSCLLMKDVIKRQGKLERTFRSMSWFSGLGRTLQRPLPSSNIDVFNTLLGSMLSSILIMDNSPEKLRYLHSFSNWLSENVKPDHTIEGAFKPDGAVFHHGNLYPAYGIGGYTGISPVVFALSGTSFRMDQEAHESLRNSLLMMHYYTHPFKWPVSVAGRHPTGSWRIADLPYAYMAMAGTPDGKNKTDSLMAAIYLKLNEGKKNRWIAAFKAAKIKPAGYSSGHWNLNYGLFDIHRRKDWLLTIRGHNRYLISNESYPGANVFGRYVAYGQLEVLFPETKTDDGSNFRDEGWDWNNIPGTTTLHVPIAKLRANIINADDFSGIEEMLITDERFAGGTTFKKQGMFAMKLHGHDKYDMGSFRATKSWFMFDSLVVCLGSDIRNTIPDYPTQTTLFQNYLKKNSDTVVVNERVVTAFPYKEEGQKGKALSVIDNRGIGYYLPDATTALLTKAKQLSRDQKDTRETTGNFAKLILEHGNAPVNAGYEYAMLVKTDKQEMEKMVSLMQSKQPLYKVLRKDSIAHTVWYAPEQLTAMAVFNSNKQLNDSLLIGNNRPCLLMYHREGSSLSMSVTDPDLAFYEGPDDSPISPSGKREEVSIYSRSWYRSPSKPSVVKLLIKGSWTADPANKVLKAIPQAGGNTLVSINCKDGLVSSVQLIKSNNKENVK
ncbi:chondroitin-sulfate-ABC endolyase/exolyase [Pedobacter sp. AK017]|uniref:chondroitinase family polysaccharide lyase n=1 Tax=Pedobacter sp. AK017 TaxID=2723073 RepID=UPI00160A27BC|nr:chondroitinase family polysaccharide lyase [Pedobacter sp. AK017]MBB5438385.1 chondroitin-sulfate-ABC endolyase/exolyase [Pedobacter sp. AK017]